MLMLACQMRLQEGPPKPGRITKGLFADPANRQKASPFIGVITEFVGTNIYIPFINRKNTVLRRIGSWDHRGMLKWWRHDAGSFMHQSSGNTPCVLAVWLRQLINTVPDATSAWRSTSSSMNSIWLAMNDRA